MEVPRAQRFPLEVPIRFRSPADACWHSGTTVDMGRTGILFRTEQHVALDVTLDMCIELPGDIGTEFREMMIFRGRVARRINLPSSHGPNWVAVAITNCEILQQPAPTKSELVAVA